MPNYRRNYVPGGTYFFTILTYKRRPIFSEQLAVNLFWQVFTKVQKKHPFENEVFCLLPDHFHCVWTLPDGDDDYSGRIKEIKRQFSIQYKKLNPDLDGTQTYSRIRRKELPIWHRRFWEHTIQDQDDLNRCMDYIHWNPVKHGYVDEPYLWKNSSFKNHVLSGVYDLEWDTKDFLEEKFSQFGNER